MQIGHITYINNYAIIFESRHEIFNNVICATSKASDQPDKSDQSLCWSLEYSLTFKQLPEHNLESLSLKEGCAGSSESTHLSEYHIVGNHMSRLILFGKSNKWTKTCDCCNYRMCTKASLKAPCPYRLDWLSLVWRCDEANNFGAVSKLGGRTRSVPLLFVYNISSRLLVSWIGLWI